jgi:hypothetical protein
MGANDRRRGGRRAQAAGACELDPCQLLAEGKGILAQGGKLADGHTASYRERRGHG